ncbi:ABC transporter permease [Actinomadura roseirufa]|uniref:ABC transporter permease n=1 Tax=Actinomadura roseirufa TaxID=2094049 RepID=UPI001F5EF705|nr:ABC transporter permease [Actinomadura roseirufa]
MSAPAAPRPAPAAPGAGPPGEPAGAPRAPVGRSWRAFAAPAGVLVAGAAWMLYVENSGLDAIERRSLAPHYVWEKTWEHVQLTAVSTLAVLAVALPLGILLSRAWARPGTPIVLAVADIGQSAPTIGVVVLLAVAFGIGFWTTVVALVAYGVLPALRNTMVGLQQVDPALTDAGRGIGMSPAAVLARVELPLASPVILAGIRTTLVLMVGTASIASFVSSGGLGDLITTGVTTQRTPVLLTGCVLIALLALLVDWLGGTAARLLAPKGL